MADNDQEIVLPEDATEMDRKALAWLALMRDFRAKAEEVLRRWRAGEVMDVRVQRRIFQAAFQLEQVCRRIAQAFGRRPN